MHSPFIERQHSLSRRPQSSISTAPPSACLPLPAGSHLGVTPISLLHGSLVFPHPPHLSHIHILPQIAPSNQLIRPITLSAPAPARGSAKQSAISSPPGASKRRTVWRARLCSPSTTIWIAPLQSVHEPALPLYIALTPPCGA